MLAEAERCDSYATFAKVVLQIALTGCRRSEIVGLKWADVDQLGHDVCSCQLEHTSASLAIKFDFMHERNKSPSEESIAS
jgi:integrase